MTKPTLLQRQLRVLGASEAHIEWAGQFKNAREAWDQYQNLTWMVWLLERLSPGSTGRARSAMTPASCDKIRDTYPFDMVRALSSPYRKIAYRDTNY